MSVLNVAWMVFHKKNNILSNLKAIKNTITLEDIHFVEADTLEVHLLTLDPGSTMGMLNIQQASPTKDDLFPPKVWGY